MMTLRERVLRGFLALLNREKPSISSIAEIAAVDHETVKAILLDIEANVEEGLVKLTDPVKLAFRLVSEGLSLEEVLLKLGWRDVERFAGKILELNNYVVFRNFRFKNFKRRYEIDVLGYQDRALLCVDCKRVRRVNNYVYREAAIKQAERAHALSTVIWKYANLLEIPIDEIMIIPLVVTVSSGQPRQIDGVPIVPVSLLNSFIREYRGHIDSIRVYKVRPPRQLM